MSPLLAWLALAASAPLQGAADAGSSSSRTPARGDLVFISDRSTLDMEAEGALRWPVPATPAEGYVVVRVLDVDGVMALVETENVESPWPSYQRRFGIPLTVRGFIRTEALLVTPPEQEKKAGPLAGLGGAGPRHGITVSGVAVWSNGRRAGRLAGWFAFDEVSLDGGSACATGVPMLAHEVCFAQWKESPAAPVTTFGQLGSVAPSASTAVLPEPLRVLVRSELDDAATLPWTAGVLGRLRFCAESARLATVDVTFMLSVQEDGRVRVASMKEGAGVPAEVRACFSKVLESRRLPPQNSRRSLDVRLTNAKELTAPAGG